MKIAAVIPQNDTTAFYRAWGPLSYLQSQRRLTWFTQTTWADEDLWHPDVVFMQRPCNENHLQIARQAKLLKKPLWVDWDDLLTELPEHSKAHYRLPIYKRVIPELLALADLITVSTDELGKAMCADKKYEVIPNAWDQRFFSMCAPRETGPVLVWRGGESHEHDLENFIGAFDHSDEHRLWMLGRPGWRVKERLPHARVREFPEIISYMRFMQDLGGRVMFVPLVDNVFNRAKSNICWQEATLAGMVTVAPDWPEWRLPGVINYSSVEDAQEKISRHLFGRASISLMLSRSQFHLEKVWRLGDVNERRWHFIKDLG